MPDPASVIEGPKRGPGPPTGVPVPEVGLSAAQMARFAAASRQADPLALIIAADAVGREAAGHGLCTAMRFDAASMTVRRIWSSDPAAYPPGGAKPKRDTPWGRHVLQEGRVFVAEGAAAIAAHFDDHALIASLGLASIVNVPIMLHGTCRGTLNLLWSDATIPQARRAMAELLGQLATPAWCG